MAIIAMSTGEFLKQVKMMEDASDQYGVKLYDREDIAKSFGISSVRSLDDTIKRCRTDYRITLQKKAKELLGNDSKNNIVKLDRIAEKMHISVNTVKILLDDTLENNIKEVNKRDEEIRENQDKLLKDVQKNWEELSNIFNKK